jgi:predicted aconitase
VYLTKDEERMLEGEDGPVREWAMRFLVKYGEALGAERMVIIESAVTGWHYKMAEFLPREAYPGILQTRMVVPTYTHQLPDLEYWREMGLSEETVKKQRAVERRAAGVGVHLTATCSPYLVGYQPLYGSHIATGESAIWIYVNSIMGAMTNPESVPSEYAAALTGRIPWTGFHLKENRRGRLLVHVETELDRASDYDALGYFIGLHPYNVPVIEGIPMRVGAEWLKGLGAGMNAAGHVGMYHIVGLTPEAPTLEAAFQGGRPEENITFGPRELKRTYELLSTGGSEKVDYVMLGCPHHGLSQLSRVARLLKGNRVHRNVTLWVFIPHALHGTSDRLGITRAIRRAGGYVVSGCWSDCEKYPEGMTVATDSAKCAYYMGNGYKNTHVWFGSLDECIKTAINGGWR